MTATIKDVAKRSGVSTATVSHVVNGSRFVSEETAGRVRQAIRELGYVANINARGLRGSVSNRIGLLVPEVSDYFPVDILEPIESVLNKAGYQLILGYTHNQIELERRQIEFFNYQRIDGLLLFPAYGDHAYIRDMAVGYPIVCLDRPADNYRADCVWADNERAVRVSVSMMLDAGHRRIGILIGAGKNATSARRLAGYRKAFGDYGVAIDPELVREDVVTHEDAERATQELLDSGRMTALYTTNIVLTISALKCLQRNNVRIPRDVALFGWGDCKWAEVTDPPLTVMRHPNEAIGRKAAEILLKRIAKKGGAFRSYPLPTEIIRRESF